MANFNKAIDLILKNEGGYQAHSNDKGNYNSKGQLVGTKYGISAKTLEGWKAYPVTTIDMQNLSITEAKEIYFKYYWLRIQGNSIQDQDNAELIFDHSVNAGVGGASKLVQKVLNGFGATLSVDGEIGSQTLHVLNVTNQNRFFDAFKKARVSYYISISGGSNSVFAKGWIKRVLDFEKKK